MTAATATAVWYDRASSRKTTARLWFDGDAVCAESDDGGRRRAPISRVQISARLANVPRQIVFPDGASLSVADNDFIDAALAARRHGGGTFIHRMEKHWRWLLLLLAVGGGAIYGIISVGVPAAAHAVANRVSVAQLQTLTETTYQHLLKANVLQKSKATAAQRQRAEALFNGVVAAYPPNEYRYRLSLHAFTYDIATGNGVEQLELANAFALPDGLIIATDALLALLSDNELSAVFAHELGHVRHRHGLRILLQAVGVGAFLTFAFGDVSTVLLASSALLNLKYSRDFEREADCDAFAYLQQRGLPTTLVRDSLLKLEDSIAALFSDDENADMTESEAETLKNIPTLLSTHPQTEQRTLQYCPSR